MGWHTGMFVLSAKVNTTTQFTLATLVFDSIINRRHDVDWVAVRKRKQDLINKGNKYENCNYKKHKYKQGDNVLLKNAWKTNFNQDTYLGLFIITAVRNNGSLLRQGRGHLTP